VVIIGAPRVLRLLPDVGCLSPGRVAEPLVGEQRPEAVGRQPVVAG
jgi:hypothetical protein